MADQLAKGEEFEKKAEKKLNGWGLFGSKYEDAADLFDKAANSYKLAKSCNSPNHSLPVLFFFFWESSRSLCDATDSIFHAPTHQLGLNFIVCCLNQKGI